MKNRSSIEIYERYLTKRRLVSNVSNDDLRLTLAAFLKTLIANSTYMSLKAFHKSGTYAFIHDVICKVSLEEAMVFTL